VTCAFETECVGGDGDRLAHNPEVADPYLVLATSAETRPEDFAPGGCHAAREHGSTCQLSALPHGAAALSTTSANDGLHVWLPEALGPLIRASFVRTLRSRTQRKPVRFTSYAATTRMRRSRSNVLHSAHEVLTPQVSSIHCRLTRGRTLVRSQSGPLTVCLRQYPYARTVLSSRIFLGVRFLSGRKALFSSNTFC
jgi:hypothetical protein